MLATRGSGGRFIKSSATEEDYSFKPRVNQDKSLIEKATPAMMVLIVIMAFALGSLWSKVKYLEKGGTGSQETGGAAAGQGQPTAKAPTGNVNAFLDKIKSYTGKAGIDGNKLVACVQSGSKKSIVQADLKQGQELGARGTPAFFINGKFLGGAFPAASFKEIIDRELAGTGSTNYKDYKDSNLVDAGGQGVFNAEPKKVDIGKALVNGPVGAKVTIVEFSDFQCPYCDRGFQTIQQLLKDYNGKIKFVFKNFPLSQIHPYAEAAAEAFECAKDQGKGWEMHDLLFENQSDWSGV